jgi:excisionase family DNA binding protein
MKIASSPSVTPCEGRIRLGQLLAWTTKELAEPPDLLSVEQVASRLGVSTRTIWRRLAANEIPPAHPSDGPTRWRADDIQAWVELGPEKKRGR